MFLWGYIATNPNHSSNYCLQHLTLRFRIRAKEAAGDRVERQGVPCINPLEFDDKVMTPQWTTRCQMPMTPPP